MGRTHQYQQPQGSKPIRNQGQFSRDVVPWICAVLSGLLSAWTAYLQAQSKDVLPSFVMGPAIIGAVCSALAGVSCVAGYFMLKKGNTYHAKHRSNNPNATSKDLKHQHHPINPLAIVILILGLGTFVTVGSYYYMIACISIAEPKKYCFTITPGTAQSECSRGVTILAIVVGALLLFGLSAFAYIYHEVIDEGKSWFNYQRQKLNFDPEEEDQSQGGTYNQGDPPDYSGGLGGMNGSYQSKW